VTIGDVDIVEDPPQQQQLDPGLCPDLGPVVEIVNIRLSDGRTVQWRLAAPRPFLNVVRPIEEPAGPDITALYITDAATGLPRYVRLAHVVDITPEVR
jgi:hypothetical protein